MGLPLAVIGLATTAIGAVTERNQILAQGKAQETALKQNADLAEAQTARKTEVFRKRSSRELSRQRVAVAKSGVELEGSPLSVLVANAETLERQAQDISIEGRNRATIFRNRARVAKELSKSRAKAALIGGAGKAAFSAGSTLLGP